MKKLRFLSLQKLTQSLNYKPNMVFIIHILVVWLAHSLNGIENYLLLYILWVYDFSIIFMCLCVKIFKKDYGMR